MTLKRDLVGSSSNPSVPSFFLVLSSTNWTKTKIANRWCLSNIKIHDSSAIGTSLVRNSRQGSDGGLCKCLKLCHIIKEFV